MATYTNGCLPPIVVKLGKARVSNDFAGDGATTWKKGDFFRINTSGQIDACGLDTDTTGPVHGMVLENWATAPTTSQFPKVLLFANDTVLRLQLNNAGTGADSQPQDATVGVSYPLSAATHATGIVTVNIATATKGFMLCVAHPYEKSYDPNLAADVVFGQADFVISQANLDARGAT